MDASIKAVSIKLGTPNLPGDTMKMSGTRQEPSMRAQGLVEVDVVGKNAWGNHVEGTVTVELPSGE